MKINRAYTETFEETFAELQENSEFQQAWESDEPRRKVVSALINQRINKKLSQRELAEKAGIKQPSLARIESGASLPSFNLLNKVAKALDLKLEINFVPLQESA